MIQRITVRNFGSVRYFDTSLKADLNILGTRFTAEIETAIELLLCSKASGHILPLFINEETRITAELLLDNNLYFAELKPNPSNQKALEITVKDTSGNDKTDYYRKAVSHCTEQDALDHFDGTDDSFPFKLCRYRDREDLASPKDLPVRTNHAVETKTFRSYLIRYIKAFEPQSINNKKSYKAAINKQGRFEVQYPHGEEGIPLSKTEEKLFLYICFLNVAEFWEDFEKIRDMHHIKKPLLIKNFLEFLDQTTDIQGLISRTVHLKRQVILFTLPMEKRIKR